ncbi:glycosyltransferase family 2 protein [Pullulanibacillus sp. KACC 23026]|uniref:glycosyltransferase family 2 protein n=1 Tax=Pullulanibacillus sp. KACC 23026 TaxID=3028315 RepID=UPI0023AE8F70|nr:glycosyltransferase family 2 protein [Pullulanibacillus sp. KACC 23026]WEG13303.1 glycosyltransferase family 2 protein [Pullulanibacillus sp. KACC 23026]
MDLSIIIVNYNTRELTLEAIQSIYKSMIDYQYEIILVDNHSSDDSVVQFRKHYPDITLIENNENLGFSKANNQGIKVSKGRYVLLLNSDTIVEKDTLQIMLDYMEQHPHVGASGCKVLLPDGSLDQACRRGFPTPSTSFYYMTGLAKLFPKHEKFNRYHYGHLDIDIAHEVDCLVGAFMMVRQEVIEQIGLLDEDFFMYGEDIDWCYRIKEGGWHLSYYPETTITHYKGASSRKKPMKIIYEFHRAMYLFHKKHYQKAYSFFINQFVYIGISLKFCLSVVENQIKVLR